MIRPRLNSSLIELPASHELSKVGFHLEKLLSDGLNTEIVRKRFDSMKGDLKPHLESLAVHGYDLASRHNQKPGTIAVTAVCGEVITCGSSPLLKIDYFSPYIANLVLVDFHIGEVKVDNFRISEPNLWYEFRLFNNDKTCAFMPVASTAFVLPDSRYSTN